MRKAVRGNRRVLKKRRAKAAGAATASPSGPSGTGVLGPDSVMEQSRQPQRKRFAVTKKRSGAISNAAVRGASTMQKQGSLLLRKQAQERMVLKEHLQELQKRRMARTKGTDAKNERRQMSKYMKELRKQQISKHAGEISNQRVDQKHASILAGATVPRSTAGHSRKKVQRYLDAPQTVGLPHGRSAAIPCTATPLPSNVVSSVPMMVSTSSGVNTMQPSGFMGRKERQKTVKAGQEHAQQRWKSNNQNEDDDEDFDGGDNVWLDDGEQQNQGGNNNNNNNSSNLQQLFSGFGTM